jgi:hypothetical protein
MDWFFVWSNVHMPKLHGRLKWWRQDCHRFKWGNCELCMPPRFRTSSRCRYYSSKCCLHIRSWLFINWLAREFHLLWILIHDYDSRVRQLNFRLHLHFGVWRLVQFRTQRYSFLLHSPKIRRAMLNIDIIRFWSFWIRVRGRKYHILGGRSFSDQWVWGCIRTFG